MTELLSHHGLSMEHESRLSRIVAGLPTLTPFVAPETIERQLGKPLRLRLGANESAFGPSPNALLAMKARADTIQNYGDPESHELRTQLASRLGVSPSNILVGPGIDGLLRIMSQLLMDPGSTAVGSL